MKFLIKVVINAIALWVAALIVGGITLTENVLHVIVVAFIFGVINAVVKPIVQILSFPFILLTLGLFLLIINTFLLWLTSILVPSMLIVDGFWSAFFGAIIISIISWVLSSAIDPKDER